MLIKGRCAFGVVTDMQNDVNNEYFKKAEGTVAINLDDNSLIRLGYLMPWLIPVLAYLMVGIILLQRFAHKFMKNVEEMPRFWLINRLRYLMDIRAVANQSDEEQKRVDLLQLMLDAATRSQVKVRFSSSNRIRCEML
jgi:hypothetical protein